MGINYLHILISAFLFVNLSGHQINKNDNQNVPLFISRELCLLSDLVHVTGGDVTYCDYSDGITVPDHHWCDVRGHTESGHITTQTYMCEWGVWRRDLGTSSDVKNGTSRTKRFFFWGRPATSATTTHEKVTSVPTTQSSVTTTSATTTKREVTSVPTTQSSVATTLATTTNEQVTSVPTTQSSVTTTSATTTEREATSVPTTQMQYNTVTTTTVTSTDAEVTSWLTTRTPKNINVGVNEDTDNQSSEYKLTIIIVLSVIGTVLAVLAVVLLGIVIIKLRNKYTRNNLENSQTPSQYYQNRTYAGVTSTQQPQDQIYAKYVTPTEPLAEHVYIVYNPSDNEPVYHEIDDGRIT